MYKGTEAKENMVRLRNNEWLPWLGHAAKGKYMGKATKLAPDSTACPDFSTQMSNKNLTN